MRFIFSLIVVLFAFTAASAQAGEAGGIPLQTNFDPATGKPLDKREQIATLADTSLIQFPYEGLQVFALDFQVRYEYVGGSWRKVSGEILDTLSSYRTELDSMLDRAFRNFVTYIDTTQKSFTFGGYGQSNMKGTGTAIGCDTEVNPNVFIGTPLGFVVAERGNQPFSGTGSNNLLLNFGRRVQEFTGKPVYLLLNAYPGNPIEKWRPDSVNWNATIADLELHNVKRLDGILWGQGEANFSDPASFYRSELYSLIENFRATSFFDEATPFMAMEMVRGANDFQNAVLRELDTDGDPFTKFVEAADLSDVGDALHYNCESLDTIGYLRFFKAFLEAGSAENTGKKALRSAPYELTEKEDYTVFLHTVNTGNDTVYLYEETYPLGWTMYIKAFADGSIVLKSSGANIVTSVGEGSIVELRSFGADYTLHWDGSVFLLEKPLNLQGATEQGATTDIELNLEGGAVFGTINPIRIIDNTIYYTRDGFNYVEITKTGGSLRIRRNSPDGNVNMFDFREAYNQSFLELRMSSKQITGVGEPNELTDGTRIADIAGKAGAGTNGDFTVSTTAPVQNVRLQTTSVAPDDTDAVLPAAIEARQGFKISVISTFGTGASVDNRITSSSTDIRLEDGVDVGSVIIPPNQTYTVTCRRVEGTGYRWVLDRGSVSILTETENLNFPSTAAGSTSILTVTVSGAVIGDPVSLAPTNVPIHGSYFAWVSATDEVSVRFINNGTSASDPSSQSITVKVLK